MKKMLPWIIVILLSITLIVGAAFILWRSFVIDSLPQDPREAAQTQAAQVSSKPISAEELAEMTYSIDEVVTNLANPNYYISASFTFEMDSVDAKKEFELLSYKIRDVINTTLNDMSPDEVRGSEGIGNLTSALLNRTNELLRTGKARHVYVTQIIITEQ